MSATTVHLHPESLGITIEDGTSFEFHYLWLRHHCDSSRHPQTGERTLDPVEIDPAIEPVSALIEGEGENENLVLTWPEGLTSRFLVSRLKDQPYAVNLKAVDIPPPDPARLTWNDAFSANAILRRVKNEGAVLVRGWGEDTEALIGLFEQANLKVRETHFGRIEDLKTDNTTNKNTDQLGYTNSAVDLHSDQTYLEDPPPYQLLQSIRTADSGGESLLTNGRALVDYIKATSRQDYELLTTVPVVFHRVQKNFEKKLSTPLVIEEPDGRVLIRLSYFTLAPFAYPFDLTRDWYRAYTRFTSLARGRHFQYRFLLQPGDFVLYDNLRMLHGRTAFSGPRWVRGIYFDES